MFDAWNELYSNSMIVRSGVLYAHVAGMLVGGGCAVAADRLTLLSPASDAHQLNAIGGVHRVVVGGIVSLIISGALMFAANVDTYISSPYYWTKMALFGLLLLNGWRLTKAERDARVGMASGWARLRSASVASLVLWLLTALCGAILPNV